MTETPRKLYVYEDVDIMIPDDIPFLKMVDMGRYEEIALSPLDRLRNWLLDRLSFAVYRVEGACAALQVWTFHYRKPTGRYVPSHLPSPKMEWVRDNEDGVEL